MKRAKMSSPEQDRFENAVREFRVGLHSALPLEDVSQFYDDSIIRNVAAIEKVMVSNKLMADISDNGLGGIGCSVNDLSMELDKVIGEHMIKNENHRYRSQTSFKNLLELACGKLKASLEARLKVDPDMDLKAMEMILENEKLLVTNMHSNNEVAGMDEDQKRKLEEQLDHLKKEMLEKQKRHLESKEETKRVEVRARVLEMSTGLIRETDGLHGQTSLVSKNSLMERVQSMYDYLRANDRDSSGIYSELLEILEDAIEDLDRKEDILKLKGTVKWVVLLDGLLHSSVKRAEAQQEESDMDSTDTARRCFNVACGQTSLGMEHSWEDEKNQFQSFLNGIVELNGVRWEDKYSDNRMRQNMPYTVVFTSSATWYPYVAQYKNGQMRVTCMKKSQEDFCSDSNRHLSRVENNLRHLMAQRSRPIGIMIREDFGDGKSAHCVLLVLYPEEGGWSSFVKDSRPINQATVPSFAITLCNVLDIPKISLIAEAPSPSDSEVQQGLTTGCMKDAMKAVGDLLDGQLLNSVRQVPPECSREHDVRSILRDHDRISGNGSPSLQDQEQSQSGCVLC